VAHRAYLQVLEEILVLAAGLEGECQAMPIVMLVVARTKVEPEVVLEVV
jgi:hypothetical protein